MPSFCKDGFPRNVNKFIVIYFIFKEVIIHDPVHKCMASEQFPIRQFSAKRPVEYICDESFVTITTGEFGCKFRRYGRDLCAFFKHNNDFGRGWFRKKSAFWASSDDIATNHQNPGTCNNVILICLCTIN